MLCVDGKRVTPGLDKEFGDVDMFGFESSTTLAESRDRLDQETDYVKRTKDHVINMQNDQKGHRRGVAGVGWAGGSLPLFDPNITHII